ncbi:MAG TPA: phage baseplate assembly protein V [Granulicella sp.]
MALPQIQIGEGMLGEAMLASVEVVQALNQHWWCTVVCRDTLDQRVPVEDLLGQSVQVKTTDLEGVEHIHFDGTVHRVDLEYEIWGSYAATIIAVSDSYSMDVTAHKQYYSDQTLSSVASTIGGRHGLSISVSASSSKALNYVQYGETDFSFLHRLADDYGAWMRPCEGGLEIFDSFQSGSTLGWRAEYGLIRFRLSGERVNPSFSGSHYDHHVMQSNTFQQVSKTPQFYSAAERLTSAVQSASQKLPAGFETQRGRAMTLADYNDQLEAESERAMGSAVKGFGSSRDQTLKAGNTVTLDGELDAKGMYGLTRVDHRWTPQGYENSFLCTPWKTYRDPQPPVMRRWEGLVPARVVAHNDPKKMGRLRVRYFWQQEDETHWARFASPHAGPDRGFMFMPEVGDEVAVAFEDGDPERPVILGALWNGMQQAPRYDFRGGDVEVNDVKRIVTKAGNRIQISDTEGKETVVLATPNNAWICLTEKSDDTTRSLISLRCDGDIVLDATGRIHMKSKFFSREIG